VIGPLEINSRLLRKGADPMKRQLTASAVSLGRQNNDSRVRIAATDTSRAPKQGMQVEAGGKRRLALTSVSAWTHTLTLTGELDRRSAATLEAELDRLCEAGVTGITLDLRELKRIDSAAVAAIAFRCGLSQRRGYEFTLIPGPWQIQDAFTRAGVADALPFEDDAPERAHSSTSSREPLER
jgi:anti-anti-sigma factor